MTPSNSRRKSRQRQRSPSAGIANPSSQGLFKISTSAASPNLGDFSRVFAMVDSHRDSLQLTEELPNDSQPITQSTHQGPRLLDIPDSLFRDIMTGKKSQPKANFTTKPLPQPTSIVAPKVAVQPIVFPPSPSVSATTSDSEDQLDSVSSRGDFDPVDVDLELNGGAGLSDVTTPPTTPLAQTITLSAGERIFQRETAKRAPLSSEQPFSTRLMNDFRVHDQRLRDNFPKHCDEGVSVFVDASNISIGFYDHLKRKLHMDKLDKLPPCIMFSRLQQILERDRKTSERYIAGSKSSTKEAPKYFEDAINCQYTPIITTRVPKDEKKESPRSDGNKWQKKIYDTTSSDSDDALRFKNRVPEQEQCVDEMLQFRMSDCVLDNEPGIMVVVTGDGNPNESGFSDGFPKHVERALKKGWVVEVYSFKETCAEIWTNPHFLNDDRWAGRLSHHHLDRYAQDMCNPAYDQQLADISFRNCKSSSKRKAHLPASFVAESLHRTPVVKVQRQTFVSQTQLIKNSRRIPSPKKAELSESISGYLPASSHDAFAASSYQQHLLTASTFGTLPGGSFANFKSQSALTAAIHI
ncbi:cell wall glucanase [Colletotrichum truncatum]|uniref:Cell wall glucanase n=1 Tax=Colletotrichum truncatum TaxID=5467 RepID=A0ACC3YZP4_COLTU|nr:cell wall glucanase [Colletotrichum truncatum]KAF6790979.1 cell wall glucanase [Colletotrichum truncatum]